jgi:hypothetical protein
LLTQNLQIIDVGTSVCAFTNTLLVAKSSSRQKRKRERFFSQKTSGEEVSASLGYALRTMERLILPIRASKTEAPPKKIGGFPRPRGRNNSRWKKGERTNIARTNPKTPRNKCYIRQDGTNPWRPQSSLTSRTAEMRYRSQISTERGRSKSGKVRRDTGG